MNSTNLWILRSFLHQFIQLSCLRFPHSKVDRAKEIFQNLSCLLYRLRYIPVILLGLTETLMMPQEGIVPDLA